MAAAGAFLAGAAFGGIRYGYLKFHLYERESVVHYSADSVKAHFLGEKVCLSELVGVNGALMDSLIV